MTKRPLESHDVKGWDGPEYELNILCAAPGCMERSNDTHHLFRRSFLGGPYRWVTLPDGSLVGNVVGLCRPHHEQVDSGAADILWENERYVWNDQIAVAQQLAFQPPRTLGDVEPVELNGLTGWHTAAEILHPHLDNECPTCHQPFPKPKVEKPHEEKKIRRTWSITVPITEREDGAETLDILLEEARLSMARAGMSYGDAATVRFFVLSSALGLFVSNFKDLVADA